MWYAIIGCGSYLIMMLAAIYVPAFFPKFYRKAQDWFDASDPHRPPYMLATVLWPFTLVGFVIYHIVILCSRLPSPESIAVWMEERKVREQLRREKHADKYL